MITPSHNPPDNGGFKYNPTNGGPADTDITGWVQQRANALIEGGLKDVRRMPLAQARKAALHEHDYLNTYVADLASVIDFDVIRRPACTWVWIRWAGPACITGVRSPSATSSTSPWSATPSIRSSAS